jgi:hypothetical protein
LRFNTGEVIKCHYFKLTLYATGSLTIECNTSFTTEFAAIGSRSIDPNFDGLINASFTGTTYDGGTVDIDDMAVAEFNFLDHGITMNVNSESKFVVDVESLDANSIKFLSELWQGKGRDPKSFPTKGKRKLEGYITFLIIREVTINFKTVNQNDTVTVSWGLTNLEFRGCEQGTIGRPYPDSFKINIDRHTFTISHVDYHQQKVRQLRNTAGVDVTANVTTDVNFSELSQVEPALENVCYLLTLASMNWVTRLFKDVHKCLERISTTLLPYFTLPFKGGYNVININDGTNCQLKRFVEIAYEKYIDKKNDFPLINVIEYYISAARGHSTENQFTIAYLALNCLASMAPKYAKKVDGKTLENPNAVSATEKRINDFLKKRKQNLPAKLIYDLADEIAYKQIGDEIKIEYLIDKFEVEFDKNTLHALVSFRGRFLHTGMDPGDEVRGHYLNTLAILERTLLAMLGWKGQPYRDKLSGYHLKTLN